MINETQRFKVEDYNFTMQAKIHVIASDLLIEITGGSHPHIGTVTVFSKEETFDSIRFHSEGEHYHKDDYLSQYVMDEIKDIIPGKCVITAGVHIDQITEEQKKGSLEMAQKLGKDIRKWLLEQKFETEEPKY